MMTKELLNFLNHEFDMICVMMDAVTDSVPHSLVILKIDQDLFFQEVAMMKMVREL
jgi:hypothetical protein